MNADGTSAVGIGVLPADMLDDRPMWHVQVGALDTRSTDQLRGLLLNCSRQPGSHVVVDLSQMDDSHELTLFALLAASARAATGAMGRVTAVGPTLRLAHLLGTVGVTVARELPVLARMAGAERISVGHRRDVRT
jgi:anti-anti-sigma regulatory factor